MSEYHLDQKKIKSFVDAIHGSYLAHDKIQHIDCGCLPNQVDVHKLTKRLFALIFPGYYGLQQLTRDMLRDHIARLVSDLASAMYKQVYPCLKMRVIEDEAALDQQTQGVVDAFFEAIPGIRTLLASDILAAFEGDPAAKDADEIISAYPAVIAIGTYRMAHVLHHLEVPLLPRMMTEFAHSLTGVDIHPGTTIGSGFFIDHCTGVVIGETAIIGDNCKLYQGVTLGAISFPHDETGEIRRDYKRHPTLEDNVIVYSNASILGDIVIGKGATIGGNVFLTRAVPPGHTVSAKPAELRLRNRPTQENRLPDDVE